MGNHALWGFLQSLCDVANAFAVTLGMKGIEQRKCQRLMRGRECCEQPLTGIDELFVLQDLR